MAKEELKQEDNNKEEVKVDKQAAPEVVEGDKKLVSEEKEKESRFPFITKENTYQTSAILKQLIAKSTENIKYACLVISSIEVELAEKVLEEFSVEMQARIMNEMLSLIQLSKIEVENFEKNLPKFIREQFGGRYVLSKIVENLKVEDKIKLTETVEQRYPDRLGEFRQIVVVFEDLFKYDDEAFGRLFGEMAADILATAFARTTDEQTDRLKKYLSRGVLAMFEQGVEGARLRSSATEINKAQQYVIDVAKQLVEDGFLPPLTKMKKQSEGSAATE
jgi:flagellar motor switch protein FliG